VDEPITPDVSLSVFRVVQEALHNVVKHSAAKHSRVLLTGTGTGLQLQVADSGVGFTLAERDCVGLGLVSMRERVHSLGGEFVIHSMPDNGTCISLFVPLDVKTRCEHAIA
jgi:two-component system sensor histidine kinase NreB